jgi:hypothetical protein
MRKTFVFCKSFSTPIQTRQKLYFHSALAPPLNRTTGATHLEQNIFIFLAGADKADCFWRAREAAR